MRLLLLCCLLLVPMALAATEAKHGCYEVDHPPFNDPPLADYPPGGHSYLIHAIATGIGLTLDVEVTGTTQSGEPFTYSIQVESDQEGKTIVAIPVQEYGDYVVTWKYDGETILEKPLVVGADETSDVDGPCYTLAYEGFFAGDDLDDELVVEDDPGFGVLALVGALGVAVVVGRR